MHCLIGGVNCGVCVCMGESFFFPLKKKENVGGRRRFEKKSFGDGSLAICVSTVMTTLKRFCMLTYKNTLSSWA